MSDELSANEWKAFLTARIQQEKGDDEGALEAFGELLGKHPRNEHLLTSRAYALSRLGRADAARIALIDAKYTAAGKDLVGDRDEPDAWVSRLSGLLEALEASPNRALAAASAVAW